MSNITKSSSSNNNLDSVKEWLNEWWITDWDYKYRATFTSLVIICVYSQIFRVAGYDLFRYLSGRNKKVELFYYGVLFLVMFGLATKLSTWKPLTTDECAKECATIIPIINQRVKMMEKNSAPAPVPVMPQPMAMSSMAMSSMTMPSMAAPLATQPVVPPRPVMPGNVTMMPSPLMGANNQTWY
jgi:hypothetical protein